MTDIDKKTPPFLDGRKQTDASLRAERAKTDAALSIERDHTEYLADESVSLNREKADNDRSQARTAADDQSAVDRATLEKKNPSEFLETDERLDHERQVADEALYKERRHVDAVLETERWRKKVAERKLFHAERKDTDKNLTSERKQTDAEAKRAAAALTTREEFLAIVSHDLRNPIGSISIAADLLKESDLYAKADTEDREFLDLIGRNAAEALRLISDLLDIERIAAGKMSIEIERQDITTTVRHSIRSFGAAAASKNISLDASLGTLKLNAAYDRDRISQVLGNIIGNAIKFTPKGGVIRVKVQQSGEDVLISVTDTGPGVPNHMRKIIFERFWQVGNNDRRGLGLGLYISNMIVEAHQGRIWVESEPGVGSTFHFSIPAGPGGS